MVSVCEASGKQTVGNRSTNLSCNLECLATPPMGHVLVFLPQHIAA